MLNYRLCRMLGVSPSDTPGDGFGHIAVAVAAVGDMPAKHNLGALNTDFDAMCYPHGPMLDARPTPLKDIAPGRCAFVHVNDIW